MASLWKYIINEHHECKGRKKAKIDHQGYRTFVCFFVCLFLMCVLVCFCLLKGTLPALRIPPIAFISFTENVQVPFL